MAGPLPKKKPKVRSRVDAPAARATAPATAANIAAAASDRSRLPIPDVTDAMIAFGHIEFMPKRADIPEEFRRGNGAFVDAVSHWFFGGAKREGDKLIVGNKSFVAKPGVDATKALRAIRCVLGSFQPKHEDKEAACAYMLSEWFELRGAA